jgi:hypothetical protein
MTAKEEINEKLRPRIMGMYGGFAFTFASVISASQLGKNAAFLIVLGFAICFASMLSIQFGIRCPFCGIKMGKIILASGKPWRVSDELRFGAHCGADFDCEVQS